jgi:hypothetical protein
LSGVIVITGPAAGAHIASPGGAGGAASSSPPSVVIERIDEFTRDF